MFSTIVRLVSLASLLFVAAAPHFAAAEEGLLVRNGREIVRTSLDGTSSVTLGALPSSLFSKRARILAELADPARSRVLLVYETGKTAQTNHSTVAIAAVPYDLATGSLGAFTDLASFSANSASYPLVVELSPAGDTLFALNGSTFQAISLVTGSATVAASCSGEGAFARSSSAVYAGCLVPGEAQTTLEVTNLTVAGAPHSYTFPGTQSGAPSMELFGLQGADVPRFAVSLQGGLFAHEVTTYLAVVDAASMTQTVLADRRASSADENASLFDGALLPLYVEPGTQTLVAYRYTLTGASGGHKILAGASSFALDGSSVAALDPQALSFVLFGYVTQHLMPLSNHRVATSYYGRVGGLVVVADLSTPDRRETVAFPGTLLGVLSDCGQLCSRTPGVSLDARPTRPAISGELGNGKISRRIFFLGYPDFTLSGAQFRFVVETTVNGKTRRTVTKQNVITFTTPVRPGTVRYRIQEIESKRLSPWSSKVRFKFAR